MSVMRAVWFAPPLVDGHTDPLASDGDDEAIEVGVATAADGIVVAGVADAAFGRSEGLDPADAQALTRPATVRRTMTARAARPRPAIGTPMMSPPDDLFGYETCGLVLGLRCGRRRRRSCPACARA
jgi:hypothetical protein